jgi:hypothetical protein
MAMASAFNRMGTQAQYTPIKHQHFRSSLHFCLRTTRAPSRNIGKFYRTVKLSAENLRLFPIYGKFSSLCLSKLMGITPIVIMRIVEVRGALQDVIFSSNSLRL